MVIIDFGLYKVMVSTSQYSKVMNHKYLGTKWFTKYYIGCLRENIKIIVLLWWGIWLLIGTAMGLAEVNRGSASNSGNCTKVILHKQGQGAYSSWSETQIRLHITSMRRWFSQTQVTIVLGVTS